jgi:hypothetical protein
MKPLDTKLTAYYLKMKQENAGKNVFKIISQELEDRNISLTELINQKHNAYEKV